MRTFRERMAREVKVRTYQLTGIAVALSATWAAGIYGAWSYFEDRDRIACEQRNELRADVRSAFQVTFAYFEPIGLDSAISRGAIAAVATQLATIPCT